MEESRLGKIKELKAQGIKLYPNNFKPSNSILEVKNKIEENKIKEEDKFSLAGRIMAINDFGKSSFIRFKDRTATLQAYIQKKQVGDEKFNLFKKYIDIGDFIGLSGSIFQTKTGEQTLFVDDLELVSKAVLPLPEKFHGLKDDEKRYRKRYLDLIMNEKSKNVFLTRSKIIQSIREFLLEKDYMEVETPMMHVIPGGAEATPFLTHHKALDIDLYLRIAPELFLKRLVVGGFERVFEINRNFRNEGISTKHNPEFTSLEFYEAYADFEDLMNLTQEMFLYICQKIFNSSKIVYEEKEIDFSKKWEKLSLLESLEKVAKIDKKTIEDYELLKNFAKDNNIDISKKDSYGKLVTKLFEVLVEPKLIQPTYITSYPVEVSPLSRKNEEDPNLTDRFELFVGGRELANGFSEINDPFDQKARFAYQVEQKEKGETEAHPMDNDYIETLEYAMPPTAGEGIGIDRLVMLFTNSSSIRDVILFPIMKPKDIV